MADPSAPQGTPHVIRILGSGHPAPPSLAVGEGDTIQWKNESDVTITSFRLPKCVTQHPNPAPIAPRETTIPYEVKPKSQGKHDYEYPWPDQTRGTRSGTIDVGNM